MMKAQKVTVTIKLEALDIQVLRGMLNDVIEQVEREAESGVLEMSDGDRIEWETKRNNVTIY